MKTTAYSVRAVPKAKANSSNFLHVISGTRVNYRKHLPVISGTRVNYHKHLPLYITQDPTLSNSPTLCPQSSLQISTHSMPAATSIKSACSCLRVLCFRRKRQSLASLRPTESMKVEDKLCSQWTTTSRPDTCTEEETITIGRRKRV